MPVLSITRRPPQSVRIGSALVTIAEVKGKHVRLNIDAPHDVHIVRTELEERPSRKAVGQ